MSIAIVAPAKYDFQDLVCIWLMLRARSRDAAAFLVEPPGGEDAEICLPHEDPSLVEIQVKGSANQVSLRDVAEFLAHCPPHSPSPSLFERLMLSPDRSVLIVVSGRCDDTTSKFVMPPEKAIGATPPSRLDNKLAVDFRSYFAAPPAPDVQPLEGRRNAARRKLLDGLSDQEIRDALKRVRILDRVTDASLKSLCFDEMRDCHVPADRFGDALLLLRDGVKTAKSGGIDAFPIFRKTLDELRGESVWPSDYVERGTEAAMRAVLSHKNVLLLSGRPRCGKSQAALRLAAEFQNLGYEIGRGIDVEAAERFLMAPGRTLRLFVLDDPLGSSNLVPDLSRAFERLGSLVQRMSTGRKLIVAQSQEALFVASGRSTVSDLTLKGAKWVDLGVYPEGFLAAVWDALSKNAVSSDLRVLMKQALLSNETELEPGCLQHLAGAPDALLSGIALERAVRIARETSVELGLSLAADRDMETALAALAIATGPQQPIRLVDLSYVTNLNDESLPGKRSILGSTVVFGGEDTGPEPRLFYHPIVKLDTQIRTMLETLQRRAMLVHRTGDRVGMAHPFYQAAAESVVRSSTSLGADRYLGMLRRGLFCVAPATTRATARNLDWIYEAWLQNKAAANQVIGLAIDGLGSAFPATADICFSFLVRNLNRIDGSFAREVAQWARIVSSTHLTDLIWEEGEPRFPSRPLYGLDVRFNMFEEASREDVLVELAAFENDGGARPTPEQAAKVLRYLASDRSALTAIVAARLLAFDEAIIRAETVKLWLAIPRSDDDALLDRFFTDDHPSVARAMLDGIASVWKDIGAHRKQALVDGLSRVARSPAAAVVLMDRLLVFDRVERFPEPSWELFGQLMPLVMASLPIDGDFMDERLHSVSQAAIDEISTDAFVSICDGIVGWLERQLMDDRLPSEFTWAVVENLLTATRKDPAKRTRLVGRLFAMDGTGAKIFIVRDFVDNWKDLEAFEQKRLIELLAAPADDVDLLRAVAITRRSVPGDVQHCVLGSANGLTGTVDDILRFPPKLVKAAIGVYCGKPGLLFWLGTHHRSDVWRNVVAVLAERPDHPMFEIAIQDLMRYGEDEVLVEIIAAADAKHLESFFEAVLRETVTMRQFRSKRWTAVLERCPDEATYRSWMSKIERFAPVVIDDLGDISRWLERDRDAKELSGRIKDDLLAAVAMYGFERLSDEIVRDQLQEIVGTLHDVFEKLRPRLVGSFDRLLRFMRKHGIEEHALAANIEQRRLMAYTEAERLRDEMPDIDASIDGWLGPKG